MIQHEEYLAALKVVQEYKWQIVNEVNLATAIPSRDITFKDVEMSQKLQNALYQLFPYTKREFFWDIPIRRLSDFSFQEFKTIYSCGKKTQKELKELCIKYGIVML